MNAHKHSVIGALTISLLILVLVPGSLFAGSATLTWQANTETDLAGYRVHYGTSSRSYGPPISVGKVTTYQVGGLEDGKTYYFAVTAVDTSGNESGYSEEVMSEILGVPGAPILVSPKNGFYVGGTTVTFSWGGSIGANNYDLFVWSDAGKFFDVWVGNVTSYTLSGFPNDGRRYGWMVYPRNASGLGRASESWSFINEMPVQPEAPSLLSPSDGGYQGGQTIRFTWAASPKATDYDLYVTASSSSGPVFFDRWVGNVTSYEVTGFPDDATAYYWQVFARNSAGTSSRSQIWKFVNKNPVPPSPPKLTGPTDLSFQSGQSITFTWDRSEGATDYDLYIWTSSRETFFDKWVGNVTSHTVTGFQDDGLEYYWCVYPRNQMGLGIRSQIWKFINAR